MSNSNQTVKPNPPQHQNTQPGIESQMTPAPKFEDRKYLPAGKLQGKVAVITGGDSGIGRAVAVTYAKEGANVVVVYLNEHSDAEETKKQVEQEGRQCLLLAGDIGEESFSKQVIDTTIQHFGKLDILVNNAAEQHPQKNIEDITTEQWDRTFKTNIYGPFFLTKAAIPHLKPKSNIINTVSIVAYKGHDQLLDYSATKGALVTFTRSLSEQVVSKGIRVNGVAPGPIWTPLIPSTFTADEVAKFGGDTPMKRPGQPEELAPAYVFLACDDSSYMSGQTIHINGGEVVNG